MPCVTVELAHLTSSVSDYISAQARSIPAIYADTVYAAPPVSRLASKPKLSPSLEAKKLVSFPQIEISTDRRAELNI